MGCPGSSLYPCAAACLRILSVPFFLLGFGQCVNRRSFLAEEKAIQAPPYPASFVLPFLSLFPYPLVPMTSIYPMSIRAFWHVDMDSIPAQLYRPHCSVYSFRRRHFNDLRLFPPSLLSFHGFFPPLHSNFSASSPLNRPPLQRRAVSPPHSCAFYSTSTTSSQMRDFSRRLI